MPLDLDLSERQRSTVGIALTVLAAFVILCAVGGLLWLLAIFVGRFAHIFLPLAVAAVMALVVKPYFNWFVERLRLPPALALTAVFVSLLVPVVGLVWFFGAVVVDQVSDLVERLPQAVANLVEAARTRWPKVEEFWITQHMTERLQNAVEGKEGALVAALQAVGTKVLSAGAGIFGAAGKLLSWAVLPIYFSFFLLARPSLDRPEHLLPFLKPETRDDVFYLVREFVNILVAFFRGQLVIAMIQGALFALGFTIVGLKYGLVIGLCLGFLNIIPYLGNLVGLSVAIPLALFQEDGGLMRLVWVMVVFGLVQMIEAYVLTPKIMGDRTGLHPMAIIVAIFFWGSALNGLTGMVLAIPLTAFFVVFWRLAREKYIRELV